MAVNDVASNACCRVARRRPAFPAARARRVPLPRPSLFPPSTARTAGIFASASIPWISASAWKWKPLGRGGFERPSGAALREGAGAGSGETPAWEDGRFKPRLRVSSRRPADKHRETPYCLVKNRRRGILQPSRDQSGVSIGLHRHDLRRGPTNRFHTITQSRRRFQGAAWPRSPQGESNCGAGAHRQGGSRQGEGASSRGRRRTRGGPFPQLSAGRRGWL